MMDAFGRQHRAFATRYRAGRSAFESHALPAYALGLLGCIFVAFAHYGGGYVVAPGFAVDVLESTLSVLAFAGATRWIGFRRIADFIEQTMLLFAIGIVCAFCSVILASTAAPLADPLLRRADLIVFAIDRTRLIADLHMSPQALAFWRFAYGSFAVTPALAMALLAIGGQRRRAWCVLTAMIGCAMVSMTFLLILPAFGTPPYPYMFAAVLEAARAGHIHTLDGSIVTGLVTFPSMHAADAVILGVAFGWLGKWAAPLVVLNVAMFFSALIVGGHYAVDLVAGGVVGFACLVLSDRVHRWIEDRARDPAPRRRRVPGLHGGAKPMTAG